MIIWGSTGREIVLEVGQFHCPMCRRRQEYHLIRIARYFTLYFIPLFETQNLGQYIKCLSCQNGFKEAVLHARPEPPRKSGTKKKKKNKKEQKPEPDPDSVMGLRVLAQWESDPYFYPATIEDEDGDRYFVQFDDGDTAWVVEEHLSELDIEVGNAVFARQQGGTAYNPGIVKQLDGTRLYIEFDDGDKEWTSFGEVRVVRE